MAKAAQGSGLRRFHSIAHGENITILDLSWSRRA
jgi:hypothetical protein